MLKMLTGLVAKVFRLGGTCGEKMDLPEAGLQGSVTKALREQVAAVEYQDAEMLDWMDHQSGRQDCKSGLVAFRWSTTGRGWRLMEVLDDYLGTLQEGIVTPPSHTVRGAISDAMLMDSPTDTQALDWLDEQTGTYTGLVIWRLSTRGQGWRLHETSWDGARATVRETISDVMRRETAVNTCRSAAGAAWAKPKDALRVLKPSSMYCITQTEPEVFECGAMAQDGFERWKEASMDDAVRSVIVAADTINHACIERDNITIRLLDPVRGSEWKHHG